MKNTRFLRAGLPGTAYLSQTEVHLWQGSLDPGWPRLKMLEELLSPDELDRAGRYRYRRDRDRFVAARGTLRQILGGYLDTAPDGLRFSYGPNGKPQLAESVYGCPLCFNVSHSNGLGLFAFAAGREVGVDLEFIRADFDVREIVEHFFGPEKLHIYDMLPRDGQHRTFFKWWTRKEACLKAQGKGLSACGRDAADVLPHGNAAGLITINGRRREKTVWQIEDVDVDPAFAAAIAASGDDWKLKVFQWHNSLL